MKLDEVQLYVACTKDFGTAGTCEEFLRVLHRHGTGWVPVRYGPYEPLKQVYSRDDMKSVAEAWMTPPGVGPVGGDLLFKTGKPIRASGWVYWRRHQRHDVNFASLTIPQESARPDVQDQLVTLGHELMGALGGVYANVAASSDYDAQHKQHTETGGYRYIGQRISNGVPGIYWANLFGPELVRLLGSEALEACPATRKLLMPDGTWILWSGRHAEDFREPEIVMQRKAIRDTLGPERIFDIAQPERVLRALPFDRSAILSD